MTPNKTLVETYLTTWTWDRPTAMACLADDVERIEWADGFPGSGVPQRGRETVNRNLGDPESTKHIRVQIARMTEENNVVLAEGTVRVPLKDGGVLKLRSCNVFELADGKVQRVETFTAEDKGIA
jgi:uncharacterized protein